MRKGISDLCKRFEMLSQEFSRYSTQVKNMWTNILLPQELPKLPLRC